jgi:hypothetical protein
MKQTHRRSIRSQSSEVPGIQQSVFWDEGIEGSVFRGMALAPASSVRLFKLIGNDGWETLDLEEGHS